MDDLGHEQYTTVDRLLDGATTEVIEDDNLIILVTFLDLFFENKCDDWRAVYPIKSKETTHKSMSCIYYICNMYIYIYIRAFS